jgi:hypothetical protein
MLIVACAFAVVFLCRDVQALMTPDRRALPVRLAGYAALFLAALFVMDAVGAFHESLQYVWTKKGFAVAAILIQLTELAIALALRKWARGRYCWIGCVLPSPAFFVCLLALSLLFRTASSGSGALAKMAILTGCWLALVAFLVLLLNEKEEPVHRSFVDDFALLTSTTALIFVPYGFF